MEQEPGKFIDRVVALANTFPTLSSRNISGLNDLKEVAKNFGNATSVRCAAQFCLYVWDSDLGKIDSRLRFELRTAWLVWDPQHIAAWQAWAAAIWFG